jgi:fatty-acyl-CoA synthase
MKMSASSLRLEPCQTVSSRWSVLAEQFPDELAIVHWVADEAPWKWYWGALFQKALTYASLLRQNGVNRGHVCAIIIRHHREFYPLYMGISVLGAIPAVLAYPNARLHPDKFRQGLDGMSSRSGLDWILTEKDLDDVVRSLSRGRDSTVRGILLPLEWGNERPGGDVRSALTSTDPDAPCLLQHSSGTTGLQKAVVLSHRAVLRHILDYSQSICIDSQDKIVSWLPLYHDMGLIAAFYLPLVACIPLVQLDPLEWVLSPRMLLEAISREAGTISWLPNFAYNLLSDRLRDEDMAGIRLDTVRMFINCSEPVRPESHEMFLRRFAPYGLRAESLAACYAMAETTFAVTQTPPGRRATEIAVSRQELAKGSRAPGRRRIHPRLRLLRGPDTGMRNQGSGGGRPNSR